MRVILHLIFKDVLARPGWTFLFILGLSLGLSGLSTLELLKTSFQKKFQESARDLFGADFKVYSRDPLPVRTEAILKEEIPTGSSFSRKTSFNTMVRFGDDFQLVRVHAIEQNWPLYGELGIEGRSGENWREEFIESPTVLVDPKLVSLLNALSIDSLKIGKVEFRILGEARKSSDVSDLDFRVSSELFIAYRFLENTDLLTFGSRARYECAVKLPPSSLAKLDQKEIRKKFHKIRMGEYPIRIRDYEKFSNRTSVALLEFKKYLGLIGMMALILAVCGTSVLHANYLKESIPEIALLRIQGLSKAKVYVIQILKLGVFGFVSSILAVFLSIGMIKLMSQILHGAFPPSLQLDISVYYFLTILIPGISGAIIPCLPTLRFLRDMSLSGLLSGSTLNISKNNWRDWFFLLSLLAVLLWVYLLSSFQSNSLKFGLIFTSCVLGASFILITVGKLWMLTAKGGLHKGPFPLSFTILDLSRTPTSSLISLTCIGLSVLMICTLPQIESSLRSNIFSGTGRIPNYFLFEILPEQVDELKKFAQTEKITLSTPVPMIRSELRKINSVNLSDYLEKPGGPGSNRGFGEMLLRRGANLTYREDDEPGSSAKIVSGKASFSRSSDMPEISLEKRFAQKLGIEINDVLEFDIQGLPYKGKVVSLRKVRWNSYEPNFFIQGAMKDLKNYPASFLATITDNTQGDPSKMHLRLLENFPNFSSVDLQATLRQALDILSKVAYGIYFLAFVTLICGFVVLFSITHFEINSDAWKWNLLRVIGASRAKLRYLVMLRCLLISGSASLTAFCLSYPIAYILWNSLFQNFDFDFQLKSPLIFVFMIPISTMLIGLFVSNGILKQKPASLFSSV